MKKGFTLLELLIVITLLVIIVIIVLVALNPLAQINKSQDGKRKHELVQLNKVFEDFYNDKQCYPKPDEVCYNSISLTTCNICGSESASPNFSPYLSRLPCDPQKPAKKYFYQVDNSSCPTWYRIYADLSLSDYSNNDPETAIIGCHMQSCGPAPYYGYDYGVSSSNIDLERTSNFAYCATSGCNACGSYQSCANISPDRDCQGIKRIFPIANCNRQNCPCKP
jgi:prepilin-type N-terminal cleavage/methylation domain-containing protein